MTPSSAVQDRPGVETAPVAAPEIPTRGHRPWRSAWLPDALVVGAASVLTTMVVFRAFSMRLNVPFRLSGDGYWAVALTKTVHQTGGWMTDARLGAPFGSHAFDFPSGTDNMNFLLLKGSTILFANPVVALNMFILGCFTLTSLAGWFGARLVGLSRVTSIVLGLVFGFAPYHFQRSPQHMFLANYVAVPFLCVLAFWLLSDRPPFYEDASRTKRSPVFRGRRAWFAVVAVGLIASDGIYYAAFAVLLIAAAMVFAALGRQWRSVRSGEVLLAGIAGVVVLNLLPSILYMARHGHNPMVARRTISEIDINGLHLVQLLSPVPGHRLAPFAALANFLRPTEGTETGSWLGTFAALGLLIALAAVARRAIGAHRGAADLPAKAGVLALVCMLVGSVSGFAWVLALMTQAEIRAWARVSIVISFLALVALGATFDRFASRIPPPRKIAFSSLAAVALVALAVADQAPRSIVGNPSANATQWDVTDRFVHSIEATLDPGAMVFQLPVVAHPEYELRNRLDDYQLFDGFIHSNKLRWSFGAYQGREGDWQFVIEGRPVPELLDGIAAAGFTGLYLDRFGFQSTELERQITAAAGPPALVSQDGRRVFYDLRGYARTAQARAGQPAWQQLRTDTLYPVTWWLTSGFTYANLQANPTDATVTTGTSAVVDLWNRGPRATSPAGRPVLMRLDVRAPGGDGHLQVSFNGRTVSAAVGNSWSTVEVPVTLSAQRSTLHLATDAPVSGTGARLEIRGISVPDR